MRVTGSMAEFATPMPAGTYHVTAISARDQRSAKNPDDHYVDLRLRVTDASPVRGEVLSTRLYCTPRAMPHVRAAFSAFGLMPREVKEAVEVEPVVVVIFCAHCKAPVVVSLFSMRHILRLTGLLSR